MFNLIFTIKNLYDGRVEAYIPLNIPVKLNSGENTFDITNTKDMEDGIYVAGSYNVIELVNTYKNGNTGINISGYNNYDSHEMWPAHNLIKKCTSMHNADNGLEDTNGFLELTENAPKGVGASFN